MSNLPITNLDNMQLLLVFLGIVIILLPIIIIPRKAKVTRAGQLLHKAQQMPLSQSDESEITALFNPLAYALPESFMPIYYQWIRKICIAVSVVSGASALYMLVITGTPLVLLDTYPDGDVLINPDAMIYFAKLLVYYAACAKFYESSLKLLMRFYHATYKELLWDNRHDL